MFSFCVPTHDGALYTNLPQSTNKAAVDKPCVLATRESIKPRFHRVSPTACYPQRWGCELAPDASLRGALPVQTDSPNANSGRITVYTEVIGEAQSWRALSGMSRHPPISASRTRLWLESGWGYPSQRLSRV